MPHFLWPSSDLSPAVLVFLSCSILFCSLSFFFPPYFFPFMCLVLCLHMYHSGLLLHFSFLVSLNSPFPLFSHLFHIPFYLFIEAQIAFPSPPFPSLPLPFHPLPSPSTPPPKVLYRPPCGTPHTHPVPPPPPGHHGNTSTPRLVGIRDVLSGDPSSPAWCSCQSASSPSSVDEGELSKKRGKRRKKRERERDFGEDLCGFL